MNRAGKTQRLIDYAIGAARQGRTMAIIVDTEEQRKKLYARLLESAKKAGCAWVVGEGTNGGKEGNIELYHVAHVQVMEAAPGGYEMRGKGLNGAREILVDHEVLEQRYGAVVEHYLRWL